MVNEQNPKLSGKSCQLNVIFCSTSKFFLNNPGNWVYEDFIVKVTINEEIFNDSD
jgi:hypothetical protein